MALKPKVVQRLLKTKFGFSEVSREPSHKWFELSLPGLARPVRTKVSGNCKDLGPELEGLMARQMRVTPAYFRQMMGCTKSKDAYYELLKTDPGLPFCR